MVITVTIDEVIIASTPYMTALLAGPSPSACTTILFRVRLVYDIEMVDHVRIDKEGVRTPRRRSLSRSGMHFKFLIVLPMCGERALVICSRPSSAKFAKLVIVGFQYYN